MINVLIIDDSALIREFMSEILKEDQEINVVSAIPNPYKAVDIINTQTIDVIILDLEMPFMDGLTFLEKIMKQRPIPVIICSSVAEEGSENALKALQLGAIDIIPKAKLGIKNFLYTEKDRIIESVKSASKINMDSLKQISRSNLHINNSLINKSGLIDTTNKVIAIGASTGGTIVLRNILSQLPTSVHGIIITQHMPEGFTQKFSESLNASCKINVKEAENNDPIFLGNAIVAHGDYHLIIKKSGTFYQCTLSKAKHVNRHRPSVDVMFKSVAENVGKNSMGILLTGMGKDGAEGLKAIKDAGGTTIVQDEKSSVIFGMPKAAIDLGAADFVLGIDEIIKKIINFT